MLQRSESERIGIRSYTGRPAFWKDPDPVLKRSEPGEIGIVSWAGRFRRNPKDRNVIPERRDLEGPESDSGQVGSVSREIGIWGDRNRIADSSAPRFGKIGADFGTSGFVRAGIGIWTGRPRFWQDQNLRIPGQISGHLNLTRSEPEVSGQNPSTPSTPTTATTATAKTETAGFWTPDKIRTRVRLQPQLQQLQKRKLRLRLRLRLQLLQKLQLQIPIQLQLQLRLQLQLQLQLKLQLQLRPKLLL